MSSLFGCHSSGSSLMPCECPVRHATSAPTIPDFVGQEHAAIRHRARFEQWSDVLRPTTPRVVIPMHGFAVEVSDHAPMTMQCTRFRSSIPGIASACLIHHEEIRSTVAAQLLLRLKAGLGLLLGRHSQVSRCLATVKCLHMRRTPVLGHIQPANWRNSNSTSDIPLVHDRPSPSTSYLGLWREH